MSKTKKVRVTIEGYVPDDFPVKDATTSGSPAEFLPLYLKAGERTVKLVSHSTAKVKVLDKPKPKPDAFLTELANRIARIAQERWTDEIAKQSTLAGLRLARAVYQDTQAGA